MRRAGFTIVELLIVIVVIGVLALVALTSFTNKQLYALDTRRIDDINRIRKALELYRAENEEYPMAINSGTAEPVYPGSGWAVSSVTGSAGFLPALKPYMGGTVPVDPVNDSEHFYYYYFYRNNPSTCSAAKPNCYILGIKQLDTINTADVPGVLVGGNTWRATSSSTRPVWRGNY